ncbi:restriction endonuclease subunit S [Bacteroides fragilis]|nr:restriction endonuclease subunit S [Bacteroides fragilis]MCE9403816.1 restriction endonuclease subunit S [Bacteroides fragilis]MCS2672840.1 restriction endonuclease subunit S [Bacteroides fragilis]
MADNKNNSERNVPPLRFPEFTGEWQCKAIEKVAPLQRGFDLPTQNLVEGIYPVIYSNGILQHHDKYKCEAPGLITGRSGTIGKFTYIDSGFYWPHNTSLWVTDFCGNCPKFIYYLYQTVHIEQFSTGSGVPTLNRNDVHRYKTSVPTAIVEQEKIAKFLSILDERIVTQNKIIEKYESLIKGIAQHCIKESISGITYVKLGDICQISTGKLDANAQVDNGIYPFFTCAEQPFKIDNFAFDTEALLISGNGANLGYINYYKGKFNAYQRTYVLDLFSENIQYIKWALKVLLPKRIAIEKSSSNTPYIVLSTLTDLRLPIPNKSNQCHIAKLMQSLERKLSSQIALNGSYNKLKQYLLRQMFI